MAPVKYVGFYVSCIGWTPCFCRSVHSKVANLFKLLQPNEKCRAMETRVHTGWLSGAIYMSKLGPHWLRYGLSAYACSVAMHYLNQCWFICNLTLMYIPMLNLNQNEFSMTKMYSKMLSTKWLPFSLVLNMLVDRILQTQHRMPNNAEITLAVYCISFWNLYRTAWKYPYRKRCTYLCDNTTWKQKKYHWYFEIMSAKHFIKCCVLRELYFAGTS